VFAEVLGVPAVGADDDFFQLGGHSLMVVTLVARLRSRGVSVQVRDVMAAPTASGLVGRMGLTSMRDSLDVLLPIRAGGSRPPFFCVHPGGGLSWSYMPLARYVPDDTPLYGLQAAGLDGRTPMAGSIPEMAAQYVEQIRAVQPDGPYHLLGWSFGGVPAHEIAVQLEAAGEDVGALVIMDSYPVTRDGDRAGARTVNVTPPDAGGEQPAAPDPEADPRKNPELRLARLREENGALLGGLSDDELMLLLRVFRNNAEIMGEHVPGRFGGDALLLVADESRPADSATAERWRSHVAGEIAEVRLPCKHSDMVRPEMLGQVWTAIANWLTMRDQAPPVRATD
jgi:thioesterase domain-containing protein/aryl carrier-like protein